MSGYYNYSMSNNAVAAYERGEKPMSKWTKADLLNEIEHMVINDYVSLSYDFHELSVLRLSVLRDVVLMYTGYHHTSNHYNRTDFYAVSCTKLEDLTSEKIKGIAGIREKKNEVTERKAVCEYLVWTGSRKHPKATRCQSEGIIKGNWFYLPDGSKKSVSANGFRI